MSDDTAGFAPDRLWFVLTGLVVVTMPALVLIVVYVALTSTRSVVLGQLTAVEAVEIYLIEVAAFAVFSYLLYRFTLYTVRRQDRVRRRDRTDETSARQSAGADARHEQSEFE